MQKLEFVLVRKNGHNNETLIDSYVEILKKLFFDFKERIGDTIIYSKSFSKDFHMNCYGKIPWGLYETE